MLLSPSMQTPSDRFETSVAFSQVISAVEYIAGEPRPFEVYVPPLTVTVPPPLSVLIAADDLPLVVTVRFSALVIPPPVSLFRPSRRP
jgi:hypothetical protein